MTISNVADQSDSGMFKLSPEEMRRLTIVRHLYNLAVTQSREADVRAGLSILTFHDAAEIFLQLACEKHQALEAKRKPDFADYWAMLAEKGIVLTEQASMKRMNQARVSIKHHGVMPAETHIEGFRSVATNFFQDNTPLVFGRSFDQISLVSLIEDVEITTCLSAAENALHSGNFDKCLEDATRAFLLSLRKYEVNAQSLVNLRPYRTLRSSTRSVRSMDSALNPFVGYDPHTQEAMNDLTAAVNRNQSMLNEAILVIGYGLDFHAYLLFKAHTPVAHEIMGGAISCQWMRPATNDKIIVQDCLNFAIDTAIRLKI